MIDNDPIGDKECGTACLLIIGTFAAAVLVIGLVVSRVAATDDPLCQYFDALATMQGVEVAEWIGYPDGWEDYPQEWDYEVFLPILDGGILQSVSGNKQWLWGYRSLDTWADQNGEHDGHHDFCDKVLILEAP